MRPSIVAYFLTSGVFRGSFGSLAAICTKSGHEFLLKWVGLNYITSIFHCFFFYCHSFPALPLGIEVNHHLYYTTLQLINNTPGRKKSNPHLSPFLLSLALLCFSLFPLSFFNQITKEIDQKH